MCDPVTLGISLALGAAGAGIRGSEEAANNRRMIEARNKATTEELARQEGFQNQAGGIFDTALAPFQPGAVATNLSTAKGGIGDLIYGNAPTAQMVGTIGTPTARAATANAEGRKIADAFGNAATRSGALGDLTGWENWNFGNRMGLADTSRNLGVVSDLSRNSANVAGLEQVVNPNNAYRPSSGLGELLTFAGNAIGTGGLPKMTLPTKSIWGGNTGYGGGPFARA